MKTLGDVFDPRSNSLNAIRLLLAAAVIVSHSWLVNGLGAPPMINGTDAGLVAVAGFFTISGYLVTASRLRSTSLAAYLWRRFLRIYPAFVVALIVVAFIFAPLSTMFDSRNSVDWQSAITYVLSNAGLFVQQTTIEHTLVDNPFPFVWNVPLWTLFYEALCYLLVGLLVSVVPRRFFRAALIVLFVIVTVVSLTFRLWPGVFSAPIIDSAAGLSSFFLAGSLIFLYKEKIPASGLLAGLCVALAFLLMTVRLFEPLAAVLVGYIMLYLGSRLPPLFQVIGRRNDISYGTYIYGFPVQQLTVLVLGGTAMPIWPFVIMCLALTAPLAWLSWLVIEKPCARRKNRSQGNAATQAGT